MKWTKVTHVYMCNRIGIGKYVMDHETKLAVNCGSVIFKLILFLSCRVNGRNFHIKV